MAKGKIGKSKTTTTSKSKIIKLAAVKTAKEVPAHLKPLVASQDPTLYTYIDHASWRFIQLLSRDFYSKFAHQKYLDGLEQTGISLNEIPLISDMDKKLRSFGWRAVPVVGFIPPNAFLEFLSLGILPIACDMRTLEHLSYTPAPDIVHEAAGHAPILADQDYANYLKHYGELARKVIFSDKDMDVYNAIRDLSDIKEDPHATAEQIRSAQAVLDQTLEATTEVSEATQLSRMGWWTFEYGLVGDLKNPKIYGAGLLSSVQESYHCLGPNVKKIPMSLDCIHMNYDITRPQPQLYVTPDFTSLNDILDQFSEQMSYKLGGLKALQTAKRSKTVTTTVFDSGVQISGVLSDIIEDKNQSPCYLKYAGPTQLAYQDKQLEDHSPTYHLQGFGTPLGKLRNSRVSAAEVPVSKLQKKFSRLEFESGVTVEGTLKSVIRKKGKNLVLTFKNCTVKLGDTVLFHPDWGLFDMACGDSVVSVFGGAADRAEFLDATGGFKERPNRQKTNLTKENAPLNKLYKTVRELRQKTENKKTLNQELESELSNVYSELQNFNKDWLLRWELLELCQIQQFEPEWKKNLLAELQEISSNDKETKELISRGLDLLNGKK